MKIFKTKRWVNSKSFWGSLLFAMALWGYTSLNTEFNEQIEVPLYVKLPPNRAMESELDKTVSIAVKGTGWNLFYLDFFNANSMCFIDLSDKSIKDSIIVIEKSDIQKSVQNLHNVFAYDVITSPFVLHTGKVGEYRVNINSAISIKPREGFVVVGKIRMVPEMATIKGNDAVVNKIKKWLTQKILFEDVNAPFVAQINLSDSLSNVVEVNPKQVTIYVEIQQSADQTFHDIPIVVEGGSLPSANIVMPKYISISVRGGVDVVSTLSAMDFSAVVNYDDIVNDSTGIIKPAIRCPENVEILKINPPYLNNFVRANVSKRSKI